MIFEWLSQEMLVTLSLVSAIVMGTLLAIVRSRAARKPATAKRYCCHRSLCRQELSCFCFHSSVFLGFM